jgi:hypothetical protein
LKSLLAPAAGRRPSDTVLIVDGTPAPTRNRTVSALSGSSDVVSLERDVTGVSAAAVDHQTPQ